jgi:hypothetical protein
MTMTLIASTTLGSGGASTITFDLIPSSFTDLLLVTSVRTNFAGEDALLLGINNSSSGNLRRLIGTGNSTLSDSQTTMFIASTTGTFTANTFNNGQIYFPNYSGATNKSFSADIVDENNGTSARQFLTAGLFSSTAAITKITLDNGSSGQVFIQNSTVSLYGITKGSDGIVTTS